VATGQIRNPMFARAYERCAKVADARGASEHRDELLAGLAGRVVEVGAGTGSNFAHYPDAVTDILAVEPEPYLRSVAERAAATTGGRVRVVDGVADALPAGDGEFDAAVASLVLCSVPDQPLALRELHRVLRPGAELRFYEHVRAGGAGLATLQRTLDVVWPLFTGGCHTSRDTAAAIERAGFTVDRIRRFSFRPCLLAGPVSPHVIGAARRA
jgi:ubiquinone/menaquinone biosynthesis C-methylase UbiE